MRNPARRQVRPSESDRSSHPAGTSPSVPCLSLTCPNGQRYRLRTPGSAALHAFTRLSSGGFPVVPKPKVKFQRTPQANWHPERAFLQPPEETIGSPVRQRHTFEF